MAVVYWRMFKSEGPTYLQRVDFRGKEFFVKRDDLIHPVISGNKWRKLKGWLPEIDRNKRVVSFGGAHSNHLPALAHLLDAQNVPGTFLIRGEELKPTSSLVLRYCWERGMELEFISRQSYRELREQNWDLTKSALSHVVRDYLATEVCVIPEGGFGPQVLVGCKDIWTELSAQLPHIDHLLLPSGTGATALGIIDAMPQDCPTTLHVISAVKGAKREAERIVRAAELRGIECIFMDDIRGGFGKVPDALSALAQEFTLQTGIPLNRNYTPKALHYLERTSLDGVVVLLHTGGFNLSGVLG